MGRYYNGDIKGKFAFALQPSNAADQFGQIGVEPGYLEYHFDENDLDDVNSRLIELKFKIDYQGIKAFFKENEFYSDKLLEARQIAKEDLAIYFDIRLGEQIKECIETVGDCSFVAEL